MRATGHHDLLTHERGRGGGSLFAGPQLSLFGRPNNHVSLMLGGELGYRLLTPRRGRFHEFTLGASYLAEWQITRVTVNSRESIGARRNTPKVHTKISSEISR